MIAERFCFRNPSPELTSLGLPGLLWDARSKAFRAPAFEYSQIVHRLRGTTAFVDRARVPRKPVADHWKDIELRPYQEAALQAWMRAGQRGAVVLPTGAGKTRIALAAMAKNGGSVLCLVPTRILLEQWAAEILKFCDTKIGIFGDGDRILERITVSTFESAYRNMHEWGNLFDLLVIDEVHHFGNGLRDEILEMSIASARLGLTATKPENHGGLAKLVGNIVYELGLGTLSGKFLAEMDHYRLFLDLSPSERSTYECEMGFFRPFHSQFKNACPEGTWRAFAAFAARSAEGRNALLALRRAHAILRFPASKAEILKSLLERHRHQRILVFTGDTASAYQISRQHLVMPLTAEIGRKERQSVVEKFRNGGLSCLVSCRVLNEGFDLPSADVAIITGGLQGEREHIQRIGRTLRPQPEKRATIYELICARTAEVRQAAKRGRSLDT